MYRNLVVTQLADQPVLVSADVDLHGIGTCSQNFAAQSAIFLKKLYGVAALCCSDRSLHTRRAAADNGNLSGIDRLAGTSVQFSGGSGIYSTAAGNSSFHHIAVATYIAPNAGSDLLRNAHLDFPGEIGVSQRRTGQNNAVHLAGFHCVEAKVRIAHSGTGQNRNTHLLLHLRVQIQCVPLGHIAGRTCVIEGVVNANVSQNGVNTGLLQQFRNLNGLFHGTAGLVFAGERTLVQSSDEALDAETNGNSKIAATDLMNSFNHFGDYANPVFQASAVLIFSVVRDRHKKIVQQVAPVGCVQVHTGETAVLHQSSSLDHALLLLVDLIHRNLSVALIGKVEGLYCRRSKGPAGVTATAHTHFAEHFRAVCAAALHQHTGHFLVSARCIQRVFY